MKVQILEKQSSEAPVLTASPPPAIWKRRRVQLAVLVLAALVTAGVIGNSMIASRYTPTAAVTNYLNGIAAGDAAKVWDQIQVMAPSQPVIATLTDQAALRASLAFGQPDVRGFSITDTTYLDSAQTQATIGIDYDTRNGTRHPDFELKRSAEARFGIYPIWRVLIAPTLLAVQLPATGAGAVSIDGKSVALPPGATSVVAVLPLEHRVVFRGTDMLQAKTSRLDSFASQAQQVVYQPTLTPQGIARTKAAVAAAFGICAQQTKAQPDGCPQSFNDPFADSGQWSVIGDPTSDLAVSFDQNAKLVAQGHYQMVFAYTEDGITGTSHGISAGAFIASLVPTATDVAASLASATGLPALQRPADATDQAAKDLVTKAFAACATSRSSAQADCPQRLFVPDAANVHWKLDSDPLAGASVHFDPDTGIFTVDGNVPMTVTYDLPLFHTDRPSATTTYEADLLWDGQQLQLITIQGRL